MSWYFDSVHSFWKGCSAAASASSPTLIENWIGNVPCPSTTKIRVADNTKVQLTSSFLFHSFFFSCEFMPSFPLSRPNFNSTRIGAEFRIRGIHCLTTNRNKWRLSVSFNKLVLFLFYFHSLLPFRVFSSPSFMSARTLSSHLPFPPASLPFPRGAPGWGKVPSFLASTSDVVYLSLIRN